MQAPINGPTPARSFLCVRADPNIIRLFRAASVGARQSAAKVSGIRAPPRRRRGVSEHHPEIEVVVSFLGEAVRPLRARPQDLVAAALASITLASTANPSPLTRPAAIHVATTRSKICRRISLPRKRPSRLLFADAVTTPRSSARHRPEAVYRQGRRASHAAIAHCL